MSFAVKTSLRPSGSFSQGFGHVRRTNRGGNQNPLTKLPYELVDDANVANWTRDNGFWLEDSSARLFGSGGMIYYYDGGTSTITRDFGTPFAIPDTTKPLTFWMQFGAWAGLGSRSLTITVYGNSGDYNESSSFTLTISEFSKEDGWCPIRLLPSWLEDASYGADGFCPVRGEGWVAGSSGHWDPSDGIVRITLSGDVWTLSRSWKFGGITYGGGISPVPVALMFDDGYDGVYAYSHDNSDGLGSLTSFERMKHHGIPASVPVIREKIDTPAYLDSEHTTEMYAAGWDLCVHGSATQEDANFVNASNGMSWDLDEGDAEDGILYNRRYMSETLNLNRAIDYYVFPANRIKPNQTYHDALKPLMQAEGFKLRRTSYPQFGVFDPSVYSTFNPEHIEGYGIEGSASPADRLSQLLDNALGHTIVNSGAPQLLYMHQILDATNPDTTNRTFLGTTSFHKDDMADFIEKLAELQNNGDIICLNISDWYAYVTELYNGG